MPSCHAEKMYSLMAELQNSVTNRLQRLREFRSDDVLPGDRYAILKFESYDRNPDRPSVATNVGTNSARTFRFLVVVRVGVDTTGMDEYEAQLSADVQAAQECLNLEHEFAEIKVELSHAYEMFEDLILKLPVDQGLSQRLRDPGTWIVNITAEVELRFWIRRDIHGRHTEIMV
jgi:hypothetical protein